MIKEAIKEVVEAGGTVSFPYKIHPEDWIGTVGIRYSTYLREYHLTGDSLGYPLGPDLDIATSRFLEIVAGRTNLGLAISRMQRYGMVESRQLDDMDPIEVSRLVTRYFDEFLGKDFPVV